MSSTLSVKYKQTVNLNASLFLPKEADLGIGEKLSPGRYKLLQGQPDLTTTKRNQNHFSTFNS